MTSYFQTWVDSQDASRDGIWVPLIYVEINDGNLYDAVLFSQIMYWHGRNERGQLRLKVKKGGHLWLAKAHEDWWNECRITARTARRCIDRMVARGLLIREVHRYDGLATVHLRVDPNGFERLIQAAMSKQEWPQRSDRNDLKGQTEKGLEDKPLTETTTETTTDQQTADFGGEAAYNGDLLSEEESADVRPNDSGGPAKPVLFKAKQHDMPPLPSVAHPIEEHEDKTPPPTELETYIAARLRTRNGRLPGKARAKLSERVIQMDGDTPIPWPTLEVYYAEARDMLFRYINRCYTEWSAKGNTDPVHFMNFIRQYWLHREDTPPDEPPAEELEL